MNGQIAVERQCGLFGKLPGHGDFVDRNLPGSFITEWDLWLQQSLAVSRSQCEEQWLDYYLVSPVWRFALSAGCVDESGWAGVLLPSVDAAGRYFPLTLVMPLQQDEYPASFLTENVPIYKSMELIALQALQDQLNVAEVIQLLKNLPLPHNTQHSLQTRESLHSGILLTGNNNWSKLVDVCLLTQQGSYSLWVCDKSPEETPALFCKIGLPKPDQFTGLLTGFCQEN